MASNTVKVTLLADAKGFQKGMADAEKSTSKFEKTSAGFAKAVQGFFALQAVQAVGRFVDESVKSFSELEQSTGSVESVFGDASKSITDNARAAADAFGLSASEFQQSAAVLGAQLKNNLGLPADEAAVRVQELIGRASDMAATFGGTTADAVAAIGSLMRGERDPIEKYGVAMNDAAISARAMEKGLQDSNGQLTPQAKGIAALDLLYDQTADSAGQFAEESDTLAGSQQRLNAQIENNKALVGQALQGAYKTALPVIGSVHDILGEMSLAFLELTGNMESAEATLIRMGNEWTEAETPLEQLVVMTNQHTADLGHWADQVDGRFIQTANDLAAGLGLTVDELTVLLDLVPQVAREQEFVAGAQDVWSDAIERAIRLEQQKQVDLGRGRGREEEYAAALRGTRDAQDDAAAATYDHLAAIQELHDEQRAQMDPAFAYAEALRDQAEAQQAANDAAKEFGEGSPEHLAALDAVRDAAYDVEDAEGAMASGMGTSRSEMETHLRSLRVYTEDQIQLILDDMERINAFTFRAKTIRITHEVTGGGPQRQHGGPVMPGTPYLVGEKGPEIMVPATSGRVLPNSRVGGSGHGPAATYNVTINAGLGADPNAIAREVVTALQRYERANGPVPITTRASA